MSNIDLSQLVTAEDKARQMQCARLAAVKAECRRRVFAVADQITQMNLAGALLTHDAVKSRGGSAKEVSAASGLSEPDVATALKLRPWIAAMQRACAAIATTQGAAPEDDAHWPPVPEGLTALAERF